MEKKIIFFIALLLCATNALAEDIDTTMFTEFGFKGKVKTVTCFYSKEDFGDIVKKSDTAYSISFDETGKLLGTDFIAKKRYIRYIYEQGKMKSTLIFHKDYYYNHYHQYNDYHWTLDDSIVFLYNTNGDLIEKKYYQPSYDDDDSVLMVTKFKYDANNKLIETNEYYSDTRYGTNKYLFEYNIKGQLVRKQKYYYSGNSYEGPRKVYDSSFVYSTSGKIIRDSSYNFVYGKGYLWQVEHKYSYDEIGRLIKVDYNFYTDYWWPEKGVTKKQILPRQKKEYSYDTRGNILFVKEFDYDYKNPFNLKEPDKLKGIYKTKEINFLYNNEKRTQIIVTLYDRDYLGESVKMKPKRKIVFSCDVYGNWTEKKVYEIQDGVEFFKEGIIREISYYE